MGNRQNCVKFQEILFRSNEIISQFFLPSTSSQTAYTKQNVLTNEKDGMCYVFPLAEGKLEC